MAGYTPEQVSAAHDEAHQFKDAQIQYLLDRATNLNFTIRQLKERLAGAEDKIREYEKNEDANKSPAAGD